MTTHPTFRTSPATILIAFFVCCTLVFSTLVMAGSVHSSVSGQGQSRRGNPEAGPPEVNLPNLNEVRRRVHPRPETPPHLPSLMRSRRKALVPRNGRKVGDPLTEGIGSNSDRPVLTTQSERLTVAGVNNLNTMTHPPQVSRNLRGKLHHPENYSSSKSSSRLLPLAPPITDDDYVQRWFTYAFARSANTTESSYWDDLLRAAYDHGQPSLVMASRELGKTLFESAEYASRARSNHDYIYDLYKTYLMRGPDSGGWTYWESQVPVLGRENVRRAFDESGEFISKVATVTLTGNASSGVTSALTARVDAANQSGNQLLARDAEWGVTLLSLPGRAGLDFGLGISYSSAAVWTRSGPYIYFDDDNSSLSPGFRLGFATVQEQFFNAQTGQNAFLLITSAGNRVELRQIGTSNIYEAADSSYLQLTDNGSSLLVRSTAGMQMSYTKIENEWRCTQIKDRNGNFITVNYNSLGDLTSVVDTMNRTISLNYDGNANLISITQPWTIAGQQQTHTWATFGWGSTTIQPGLSGVALSGIANGQSIPVLTMVGVADGSYYKFAYTNWNSGQVSRITQYASDSNPAYDNHERNHTVFNYLAPDDSTRLTDSRVAAENWTGINGVPSEVTTQFGFDGGSAYWLNSPDGTVYKEFYGTGWQKRLPLQTETWSGGVKQKWTSTAWTQDNPSAAYFTNPRAIDSYIYDAAGNVRRTHTDYTSFGLPSVVMEYQTDAASVYRITVNNYNLNTAYTSRRIIGLIGNTWVFDGSWNPYSVVNYDYDAAADLQGLPNGANAVQHDYSNYGTSFLAGRGNLTSMTRWDATDPNNSSKAVKQEMGYNVTGAVMFQKDPLGHQRSVGYAESFSDNNNNRNTFAYPTTTTDPDGFSSSLQYNFDFGARTRVQGSPPAGQAQGVIQTFTYDNAARLQQVTTANNNSYTRYVYGPYYMQSYSTVNNVADDTYAIQTFDGAGRVIGAASNHPGSVGTYKAQMTVYDLMGRVMKRSNPAEITAGWVPTGDDAAGWLYTQQTYDWKGRPLVTTNPDTTSKSASYGGCGCAGGEVATLTDEGTTLADGSPKKRQQKIYSDVLGRTVKKEMLNWDGPGSGGTGGSVYSSVVNNYNVRDQVTLARQFQGSAPSDPNDLSCPSGTCQQTTMTYDGHARLKTKHEPEQQVDPNNPASTDHTTWDYKLDDLVEKVTDARAASATYSYNSRNLVTAINYSAPSGITAAANVTYGYDAAGNRTSMTDGLGSKSYSYDQLSQLMSETRSFNGVGSFALSYDYNLARQLKKMTDFTNMTINYAFDSTGRLSGVTGSDNLVGGVTNYSSGFQYRAWGGLKQVSIGGSQTSSVAYNARLQATNFNISGGVANQNYDYYNDGRLSYVHNTADINFDSSFSFDQAGRLTTAAAGGAARHDSGPVPIYETFQYNVWGNTSNRWSESWLNDFSDSASYTNGRRTGWTYDADGRVATIDTRSYTYDAAGKTISFTGQRWSTPGNTYVPTSTTVGFDGDGWKVRETSDSSGSAITTYLLRSSILRGEIVTELNSSGQKQFGYVYTPAGGLIARQVPALNYVMLKQSSPTGASEYEFFKSNTGNGQDTRHEFDPLGANVRLNPGPVGHGGGAGDLPSSGGGASDSRFGDLANPAAGCVTLLDGVPTFCDFVTRMGNGGGLQLRVGTTRYDIQLLGGSSTLWVDAWEEFYIPGKGAIGHDENGNDNSFDVGTTGIRNVGYFITIPSGATGLGTLAPGVLPQQPAPTPSQILNSTIERVNKRLTGDWGDCLNLFKNFDPIDFMANHLSIGAQAPGGAPFLSDQQLGSTRSDHDGSTRLASGETVFNQNSAFFTGTVLSTTGNALAFPGTVVTPQSSMYGLSLDEIRELAVFHELFHINDVSGAYNDNTGNSQTDLAHTRAINQLIREKCGFP